MSESFETGWYGKLPSRGDFVQRGIEPAALRVWEVWLQAGMHHARQALGVDLLEPRVRRFPVWRWLAWPDGPANDLLAGVLAPSHDRVGRAFPFLLQQGVSAAQLAPLGWAGIEAALARLARTACSVCKETGESDFEAVLEDLGNVFEAPGKPLPRTKHRSPLQLLADSPGTASLWWTAPANRTAPVPLGDGWPPHAELLLEVLGGASP